MRKKKILAIILVAILSLSCLTGCSDKGKEDMNNKLNNKTTETTTETTKKDDSKADDKTSESTTEDKKSDSTSKPSEDKKSDSNSGNTGSNSSANKPSNGSSKSDSNTSKPSQSTEKPAETKPSKPAHQHTWVDHTATKKVPRTVHHDAVYETVTIPAVTKHQIQCLTCGQWFDSLDDLYGHQIYDTNGACSGFDTHCERDVVITPAHTEQKLVKEAYDETVYDTQTYVDYQYCSGCGQHK